MTTILLLAANPKDTSQLELYREIYEIDQVVRSARYGSLFKFEPRVAVRRSDLLKLIEEYSPDIIHFSGHGSPSSAIYLEDDYGNSQLVSSEVMRSIFSMMKSGIKCVVFNACYLERQASIVAEEIDGVVIGMTDEVADKSAIEFAKEFYRQLANGKDVFSAYKAGRIQLNDGPQLLRIHHPHAVPSRIKFVQQTPVIIEILAILLLGVLVPLVSTYGFASIFYTFSEAIAQQRENMLIWSVAITAGILGLICGITWNKYLRPHWIALFNKQITKRK